MGRKQKNKLEEASLVFRQVAKIKKYDVQMPFLYAITVETDDPNNAKMQTIWEFSLKDGSKLDELIKDIESHPFKVKVIKVEPVVRQLTDLCPSCHKRGVPKIEKKNTSDNRVRSGRYKETIPSQKKREPEYWLTYVHTRTKKCRICQYMNTSPTAYKHNKIDIEKYFFPKIIGNMNRGSIWCSDQSQ